MDDFEIFIEKLQAALKQPLPGLEAQLRMAGMRRIIREGHMEIPPHARNGAVLALFYPFRKEIRLVFMKRTEYPGVHSGQISFPGGGAEPEDPSIEMTALRETQEEIGVDARDIRLIGKLSELYIPPSNFLVTPVVGFIPFRPEFQPDPQEVDSLIEISLDDLLREDAITEKEISIFPAARMTVPCYFVNECVIWGATAMMLNELVAVIRTIS
jgi:8-oxo-dGTP pyrophosphatase MutT (NUDIX family)